MEMNMKKLASSILVLCLATCSSMFTLANPGINTAIPVVIPDGTEISAVTTETISSKTANEDDPINFKVDEDVVIAGSVVIAKGTTLKGVVTNAKKSGRMGKGGELNVRVESTTTVDGQKLKVRAAKGKAGDDKTGSTIALTIFISPLFLLKRGKNAEIKEGTKIKVFTDEEKTVNVVKM
ncbi:hypothetical protein BH20ACI2_BH20ACI2_29300 [soil metagenome]